MSKRTIADIDRDIAAAKVTLQNCVEHGHRPRGAKSMRRYLRDLREERRELLAATKQQEERNHFVTRYVPTHINTDGQRTLMTAAQGRYTYATAAEAQAWIDAVTANNSAEAIAQLWGAPFEVRPCPCWPDHFDPQTIWFD